LILELPDSSSLSYVSLVLFFALASGFFSASEIAFRNVYSKKLQELEKKYKSNIIFINLIKDPQSLIFTILVSKVVFAITAIVLSLKFDYNQLGTPLGMVVTIFILSIVIFILLELLPKFISLQYSENIVVIMSYFIYPLRFILKPFYYLADLTIKSLLESITSDFGKTMDDFTEEEIKAMVEKGHETGVLELQETEIINSALNIDQLTVSSILTPRVDMRYVSIDTTVENALDLMLEEEYSRLPVYEDNIDNILGIVHIKDLIKYTRTNPNSLEKYISLIMRKAYHVPENKQVSELLKEMQLNSFQMAIVNDEYGGTVGLVAMEDILEVIVGDIRDEHDTDEVPLIQIIDETTILADGMLNISEVNKTLKLDLPNNQTVGKLVFNTLGEVPNIGQSVVVKNVCFRVEELDGIRIQKVLITLIPEETENQAEKTEEEISETVS